MTPDTDSDGEQHIPSFIKLSLHQSIDTNEENEVIRISQASNNVQRKKLVKLLKRYTENKEELIRNAKDLYKFSSILRRDKRQTILFEEYSKLCEIQGICKIIDKKNYINISLPQEINTMKKLSNYSVEELKDLTICLNSNYKNENENIEDFLLSFGSSQIEEIMIKGHSIEIQNENLNSEGEHSSYLIVFHCSSYFYGLRDVISKATTSISINRILFSSKEFSAILRAAKHAKQLYFSNCNILTDADYELGQMEGSQIEILRVADYLHVSKHSRDYEGNFMKIFLSILGCPNLLRSLSYLRFNCGGEMKKKLLSKAKEILGNDYDILMPSFYCF